MHDALEFVPSAILTGDCDNPSAGEVEEEGSELQGHPWLHTQLKASLGSVNGLWVCLCVSCLWDVLVWFGFVCVPF